MFSQNSQIFQKLISRKKRHNIQLNNEKIDVHTHTHTHKL